jgi:hypothetical protein
MEGFFRVDKAAKHGKPVLFSIPTGKTKSTGKNAFDGLAIEKVYT